METVDVCVVGAGPVGGTLACLMSSRGARVAVVDRAPLPPMEHPAFDGRAFAIAAGSRKLLEEAGIWAELPCPVGPIRDIRVSDGTTGRAASRLHLHFDHRRAARDGEAAAPFGWMVEARSLRMALNRRLPQAAKVLAPAEVMVERSTGGAVVQVAGGPTIACKLVVAAEGRQSPLREAAGIAVTRIPYDQVGIVCAISHALPHHGTALEHFLPAGPFAQLPMAPTGVADHVSAIVWTERAAAARVLERMDDAVFAREVARRLGDHLGAVSTVGRRWFYPLSAMHAHRYWATRLALVGDAAHGIHPIAGQGLNLGFRDADSLAGLVAGALREGRDPGADGVLAAYQRARRPDNLLMLAATDTLDRLFSTSNPLLTAARRLGIGAVDRMPALKRVFMRTAMGASALG